MRKIIVSTLLVLMALTVGCTIDPSEALASTFASGDVPYGTEVVLSTPVKKASIHYTVDGSDPTPQSTVYESPIPITLPTVLKAIAVKKGELVSNVEEYTYRPYTVGQAGGYVFYDCDADNDTGNADGLISTECGWRYLEAAPADITVASSSEFVFGFYKTTPTGDYLLVNGSSYAEGTSSASDGKSTGTAIGTGKANTAKLVSVMGSAAYSGVLSSDTTTTANYAARLCDEYSYGGYSDWFLPSKDELAKMYSNLKVENLGGFTNSTYWSSSEANPVGQYSAWWQVFGTGHPDYDSRYKYFRVRAIRAY